MEKYLNKIDQYFSAKSSTEKNILFLFGAIIGAFIAYSYLFPYSDSFLRNTKNEYQNIEQRVQTEKDYLYSVSPTGNSEDIILNTKRGIQQTKDSLENINHINLFLDNKFAQLDHILYDEKNWANFIDQLSVLANSLNIKIIKLANQFNEASQKQLEEAIIIDVALSGAFKNILAFINLIEKNEMIVDIFEIDLVGKERIEGNIKIAIWGMKY